MLGFIMGVLGGWATMALWVWFAGRQLPNQQNASFEAGRVRGRAEMEAEFRAKRSAAGKKAAHTRKANEGA